MAAHHEREFGVVKGGMVNIDDGHGHEIASGFSVNVLAEQAVLYRSEQPRPITVDELFLDLIIVANVAGIGHELRVTFEGWFEVEKFLLLFFAISNVWRVTSLFWNLFGAERDVPDKFFVGVMFFLLTMIGVGAHEAFGKALPYVGAGAFFGMLIPSALMGYFSYREPLLNGKHNVVNHGLLVSVVSAMSALPYFIAMFVKSDRVARILFWIPPVLAVFSSTFTLKLFRWLHRSQERQENRASFAVHIELMIEKYQVLTLIVIGENMLAIIHEAANLISKEGARISLLYWATAGATIIVGAFQLVYVDVDNYIMKNSTHAIRHNALYGIIWGFTHTLYHSCLVLFAGGLGIMFRDIIIKPKASELTEELVRAVVRAATPEHATSSGPEFDIRSRERWLFSGSWAGVLLFSAILSLTHDRGPREKTKVLRLVVRTALVLGIGIGMPFSGVSAGQYMLVYTLVTMLIGNVEFWLVSADSYNLLRFSRGDRQERDSLDDSLEYDDDDADEYEVPENLDGVQPDEQHPASPDPEAIDERMNECASTQAVQRRLKTKNPKNKLVKVEMGSKDD